MKRTKQFFMNSLILSISSFLLRAASVAFNAYLTRKLGSEGIGLFSLIMSVYMFASTFAASGIQLAATRLVTEELSRGCETGIKKAMQRCMTYSLSFGLSGCILLWCFAPLIGNHWLSDARTVKPLFYLSFSLPFSAMSASMTGYFVATRRIAKSASAQILELTIKITITAISLQIMLPLGTEFACVAVVLGTVIAETFSFIFLYLLYCFDRRRFKKKTECNRNYTQRMLSVALPVAVSSYLRSGLVTLEHLLIPKGLNKYGASKSASLAQYGVVHGMVMPVLLFPSAILIASASLLIPELTDFQSRRNANNINRLASRAYRLTLLFSIAAAGIFFSFSNELGYAIYRNGDAALFMRFLAPLVCVMYLDSVTDAMLKGLNQQVASMRYNIIDSAVSVILIYILLPRYGINGYVAIIFITELLNAFLSINRLFRITDFTISLLRDVLLPMVLILTSAFCVRWFSSILFGQISSTFLPLTCSILATTMLYGLLLSLSGTKLS